MRQLGRSPWEVGVRSHMWHTARNVSWSVAGSTGAHHSWRARARPHSTHVVRTKDLNTNVESVTNGEKREMFARLAGRHSGKYGTFYSVSALCNLVCIPSDSLLAYEADAHMSPDGAQARRRHRYYYCTNGCALTFTV